MQVLLYIFTETDAFSINTSSEKHSAITLKLKALYFFPKSACNPIADISPGTGLGNCQHQVLNARRTHSFLVTTRNGKRAAYLAPAGELQANCQP